ncbi:tripartite tricarboxylate transporter TctB family protein [Roseiarcaceae bacterium H3SJ34-1]|uniref:tripartite tricarboxylate transporter TctB family protein n=1 Tax=Terripilifer ovatus TaxID=3032367 RepID=UPI003AB99236|nr:tripartite tricarboxylate transporter TctB family protein [Roseiarcaceae bacterium H3SJ34-1]
MNIRAPKDFWSGLFFTAVGMFFVAVASGYRLGDMHRLGPGMFPVLVGSLMALLGFFLAGRSLVMDGEPVARLHRRSVGIGLLSVVAFGIALRPLGLVPSIVILVLVSSFAGKDVRIIETIVLALVLALLSVVVFVWVVGMEVPLWPEW